MELHYKLFLSCLLRLHTLPLVLPDLEPLAILVDIDPVAVDVVRIAVVYDLVFRVDEVNTHVHELLVVVPVGAIEAILSVEEVLVGGVLSVLLLLMRRLVQLEGG